MVAGASGKGKEKGQSERHREKFWVKCGGRRSRPLPQTHECVWFHACCHADNYDASEKI